LLEFNQLDESVKKSGVCSSHTRQCRALTLNREAHPGLQPPPGRLDPRLLDALHDGPQFESLYESLDPDHVLESATMDKAYDADRIRERLSYDGVEPVIPPKICVRRGTPLPAERDEPLAGPMSSLRASV
jgi:hypothetical protein